MWTFVEISVRNLLQARRRTTLLVLAISLVTALMILLQAFSTGLTDRMVASATMLMSGHVNVGGYFKARSNGGDALVGNADAVREAIKKHTPGLGRVADRVRGWGRIIGPESSLNSSLSGLKVDEETELLQFLTLAEEKEYKEGGSTARHGSFADLGKPNSVILFGAQAKRLGVVVGDTVTFVTEATGQPSNTVDLTVVAIAEDLGFMSNWTVFVPREVLTTVYTMKPNVTGVFQIYLKDPSAADKVRNDLAKALQTEGYEVLDHDPSPYFMKFPKIQSSDWLGQRLDLTTWNEEISFLQWITAAVSTVSVFLLAILTFIIAGGIANALWMSVRERTKEIGTMRAIGIHKAQVLRLFLMEATLLGLVGTVVGCALGGLVIFALNAAHITLPEGLRGFLMTRELRLAITPAHCVAAIIVFTMATALAALWPALRAARLRPVEAMLHAK